MRNVDVPLWLVTLVLCLLGAVVLDSATVHHPGLGPEIDRQLGAMGVGIVLMVSLSRVSPVLLSRLAIPLYGLALLTLGLVRVPGIGQISHGARRWISLGPAGSFEPSELMKLAVVIAVAALLSQSESRATPLGRALAALALAALPAGLILMQPDMGTAIVLVGSTVVMLTVAGASPILLAALACGVCVAAPHVLLEYQRQRLMAYVDPSIDPQGLGYNLIQAKIAVGAGREWGTGLYAGGMSQHGFVPENHTDFIFSVIGEELGFVGCCGFLALYAIQVGCMLRTALGSLYRFDMLLATGLAAMIALHVLVNIGMVLGLLPATGLPLPFASYGGTAVLTHMAAIGMALSVYQRTYEERL